MRARMKAAVLGVPISALLSVGTLESHACEAAHRLRRILVGPSPTPVAGQIPPTDLICWGGACATHGKDGPDTWGQFKVDQMPTADWDLDHVTMVITRQGGGQETLVAKVASAVCTPPAGTVAGCTERYRLVGVTACPLNQAPCSSSGEVSAPIANLDQVNTLTSGGCITLSDGQEVCGSRRRDFWLFYDVCCPDKGQFGAPGDTVNTTVSYTFQLGGDPQSCATDFPRPQGGYTELIPLAPAMPCS